MAQYMIVTRFNSGHDLATLRSRAALVKQKTVAAVPELASKCGAKFALLGCSIDAIDIFHTDDVDAVSRAANIISVHGQAQTEVLPVVGWGEYLSAFSSLKHEPPARLASAGDGARKYAVITKFPQGFDHATLPQRSAAVKHNIIAAAPVLTGKWSNEFIVLGGSFDGIDIVESDDLMAVATAANIIRVYGGCSTELAVAVPWNNYLAKLPQAAA
ncbi:hypothetical protein ACFFJT_18300 [Dyella flava]|uniref:GYD domain-containing protein n=1 Tax=Dyella flava TaxID=1920170 RepID=A0ABS2JZL6_9GAMM|nr:hypothetical protein [Dyella flava]MBM7124446.1 hypothetical protein [Dyella flava]GLQ51892.1 hypothetical protein GCM10010872_33410 [Dyella flava]